MWLIDIHTNKLKEQMNESLLRMSYRDLTIPQSLLCVLVGGLVFLLEDGSRFYEITT